MLEDTRPPRDQAGALHGPRGEGALLSVIPVNEPRSAKRELANVDRVRATRVDLLGGPLHRGVRGGLGRLLRRAPRHRRGQRHGGASDRRRRLDLQPGDEVIMPTLHDHLLRARRCSTTAACPCWSTPTRGPGAWTSPRSRTASRRERGRSCRCTSTATRSTWSRCGRWPSGTACRSSRTPPRRTAPSTAAAPMRRGCSAT